MTRIEQVQQTFKEYGEKLGIRFEEEPFDNRCDIWSVGVILYIMLSGKVPFEGNTEEEIKESIKNTGEIKFDEPIWL